MSAKKPNRSASLAGLRNTVRSDPGIHNTAGGCLFPVSGSLGKTYVAKLPALDGSGRTEVWEITPKDRVDVNTQDVFLAIVQLANSRNNGIVDHAAAISSDDPFIRDAASAIWSDCHRASCSAIIRTTRYELISATPWKSHNGDSYRKVMRELDALTSIKYVYVGVEGGNGHERAAGHQTLLSYHWRSSAGAEQRPGPLDFDEITIALNLRLSASIIADGSTATYVDMNAYRSLKPAARSLLPRLSAHVAPGSERKLLENTLVGYAFVRDTHQAPTSPGKRGSTERQRLDRQRARTEKSRHFKVVREAMAEISTIEGWSCRRDEGNAAWFVSRAPKSAQSSDNIIQIPSRRARKAAA